MMIKAKYLALLLLLISFNSFAQGYLAQIEKFRNDYKADFLVDKNSPLKKDDLQFLRFYAVDSTYRVTAEATILHDEATFIMSAFVGTGQQYIAYARLNFNLKGKAMELTVYRNPALARLPQYADYLFLPFTDDTNGKQTYGGGRYIDLREGDFKNGTLVIDFNKAYNPYCAFAHGYACPKPPDANKLPIAIAAGEQQFAKPE